MNFPATFTAAQIAGALGSTRQAVRQSLAPVRADGKQLVRGNEAAAWSISSLPASMQGKLERRAMARGCRNPEHLLRAGAGRYESSVPVNQLARPIQQRAMKLREALADPLTRHAQGLKGAALEEMGLREYRRVLGFEISPRHWRRLFNRAIGRDGGEENWDRLDLYLDDHRHEVRPAKASTACAALGDAEKILLSYASHVREPSQPKNDEKAMLWVAAFEQRACLVDAGLKPSKARRSMRRALWNCGVTLAKNEETLSKLWRVKEAAWREDGGKISALKDARAHSSGNFRTPEIPQGDFDLFIAHAVKFGGRLSQGWRHVLENRMLSAEVQSYYEGESHASKSFVPRIFRDAAKHEVAMMRDIHHGPRTAKLNGAYINRDWSGVAAGDWYQADDITLNSYFWCPDENGGFMLTRGQVLLMIDVRSTCILGFAILDQKNYSAHAIRTLITRTCDTYGLPRQGFYFEGGIWENSRLLKGDAKVSEDEMTWTESEGGLRDLGLRFIHSRNPRSKPVERVIGAVQNLLDGEPGDAGRHEMKDGFERLQWRKREVETGRAPASDYFYSYAQWQERLAHFCKEYNGARNDGKMTRGLTPSQAWKHFQTGDLQRFSPVARYLLARHKWPRMVGRNGIVLRFGKQTFTYYNEQTSRLKGQQVLAWFNPELPELLAVTDMNRENSFVVERVEDVPAIDAEPEVLGRAMARVNAQNGYARQRYQMIAPLANLNPRPMRVDPDAERLGRQIELQKIDVMAKRKKREAGAVESGKAFSRLGYRPRLDQGVTEKQVRAVNELTELLKDDAP